MAYYPYPYYPATYQPQIQPQTQQTTTGIIWVSGPQEAQMYPVAPNNAVALWEQSGKSIFLKSADATGKPTMRVYDLIERSDAAPQAKPGEQPTYATKDELGVIAGAIKGALADIEQMKGDLYGVAGRKKVKKEAAEDDA